MWSYDKNIVLANRIHLLSGPPFWNQGLATGPQDDSINMNPGAPWGTWLTPCMEERVREHLEGEKQALGLMWDLVWAWGILPGPHCCPCQSWGYYLWPVLGELAREICKKTPQSIGFPWSVGLRLGSCLLESKGCSTCSLHPTTDSWDAGGLIPPR